MSGKAAIVLLLIVVLLAGAAAAVYFLVLRPAAVGPLPARALVFPGETVLLMGLDVKFLVSGAQDLLYGIGLFLPKDGWQELMKEKESAERALKEAEARTGVRLGRDLDQVAVALWGFEGKEPKWVVAVIGRFDRARVLQAVEAALKDAGAPVTSKEHHGTKLVSLPGPIGAVMGAPEEGLLLLGEAGAVESAVASRAQGRRPVESNASLMGLLRRIRKGATFWMVADQGLMAAMGREMRGEAPFPLPRTFTVAEYPGEGFEVVAQMADEASARSLEEMSRSRMAALELQALGAPTGKVPPIVLRAEGKEIRVSARSPAMGGVATVGIVAAIAIPSMLRARVSANEAAAIGDTRTVISAQAAYASVTGGYYGDMPCLSEPTTCMADYPSNAPTFLDATLASLAVKSGYRRSFFPGPPGPRPRTFVSYAYTAVPAVPGQTGVRSFCGDASGRICLNHDGSPFTVVGGACPPGCQELR